MTPFTNRYGILLGRTATHIYLSPHPLLTPYVAHYTLCPGSGAIPATPLPPLALVPDAAGCLVFDLVPGGCTGRAYGPTTKLATVANDLGMYPLRFFVEFRPGGFHAFTPVPQWELSDRVLPLRELDPDLDRRMDSLWVKAPDLDELIRAVDTLLLGRLAPAPGIPALLHTLNPRIPVSAWAEGTGYSQRHLSRLLRDHAGLGAKALIRVFRINEAVRRLRRPIPLSQLAQDLGYFDQAHFDHAFQAVCGVSPSVYRSRLSDFYNEPLKF